ncbi:MAG TPA: RagB/SusD family nutrient uptake outer membrane protein, partial [Pedobacter sp.]
GDFQALLDNVGTMNGSGAAGGEVSSDDYYLTDEIWSGLTKEEERRMYTWEKDYIFSSDSYNDWRYIFNAIYTCNTALTGVDGMDQTIANSTEGKNVKGQALFCRGNNFLDAAIVWCLAYDKNTASTDLGLPLRRNTDFNEKSVRSSLQQTYDQILSDLKSAADLLPVVPLSTYRPSKAAAYGMLARTYLSMRDYDRALLYADSCLQLNNYLLDLNTITITGNYPFTITNNREVIYFRYMDALEILTPSLIVTPAEVYNSFSSDDLRKTAFFRKNTDGTYRFKGYYGGTNGPLCGIATNEVYLMKAECLARKGKVAESMDLLNTLLIKRWDKTKTYIPFAAADAETALNIILKERRKELMMRGLRWMDIKRLNKEEANISLTRTVNGKVYTLPPNDLKFALPIPEDIIAISGMVQNYR